MNTNRLALASILLLGCVVGVIATAAPAVGPGMSVTYNSAIKDTHVNIMSASLPDGRAFPHAGGIGGKIRTNANPLNGGASMGTAPDGRQLPEYIDFEWRESPVPPSEPTPMDWLSQAHKDWETKMMADFYTHPVKNQRVFIRNRVPAELVKEVIEANSHYVKGQGNEASIEIFLIWTDYGIKLRWQIWYTPEFRAQYFSRQGGDELVPSGTTMIAGYSNTMVSNQFTVQPSSPGVLPERHPKSTTGMTFSSAPNIAYTERPISGGEKLVVFESELKLPEWIDFDWRKFPTALIPREAGEDDVAYDRRLIAIYSKLPIKHERVFVSSRIPQEIQDEIASAVRNAQPHKMADSLIYLYFVWTDNGIKMHWRLKRSKPDGSFVEVREGGDEIVSAAPR